MINLNMMTSNEMYSKRGFIFECAKVALIAAVFVPYFSAVPTTYAENLNEIGSWPDFFQLFEPYYEPFDSFNEDVIVQIALAELDQSTRQWAEDTISSENGWATKGALYSYFDRAWRASGLPDESNGDNVAGNDSTIRRAAKLLLEWPASEYSHEAALAMLVKSIAEVHQPASGDKASLKNIRVLNFDGTSSHSLGNILSRGCRLEFAEASQQSANSWRTDSAQTARNLLSRHPKASVAELSFNPEKWMEESQRLALAIPQELGAKPGDSITLSKPQVTRLRQILEGRIVLAGYRLAALINSKFSTTPGASNLMPVTPKVLSQDARDAVGLPGQSTQTLKSNAGDGTRSPSEQTTLFLFRSVAQISIRHLSAAAVPLLIGLSIVVGILSNLAMGGGLSPMLDKLRAYLANDDGAEAIEEVSNDAI